MDPLITNGVDPALLRVLEKRGDAHELARRPKRAAAKPRDPGERGEELEDGGLDGSGKQDGPSHRIDDLA